MKRLICFVLCLWISVNYASSQHFVNPPYLKVTNTLSGQVYKIKRGKKITVKLVGDSVAYTSRIDDIYPALRRIRLRTDKYILVDDIEYIEFQPMSRVKRTLKQAFYVSYAVLAAGLFLYESSEGTPLWFSMLVLSPFVIAPAELGGLGIQLMTPRRAFYRNNNLDLEIVPE